MASINFNSLQNINKSQDNHTYVDFHLDLQENVLSTAANWNSTAKFGGRDVKVAYDLNAIRNSLTNLFNTVPGERYLLPEYGTDLRRYVFENITEITGLKIGRTMRSAIINWDSRLNIATLDVIGVEDKHEYHINLTLEVPFLTEPINISSILTREGYFII